MTVYLAARKSGDGIVRQRWCYDFTITLADGKKKRVQRVAKKQTERAAIEEEKQAIAKAFAATPQPQTEPKQVTTFELFAQRWLDTYAKTNNKQSECESKESILRLHLVPMFGELSRDPDVTPAKIDTQNKIGKVISR